MRPEDKKIFAVGGYIYFIFSMAVIIFPRWLFLFVLVIIPTLIISPLGIWTGLKDAKMPMGRRVSFVILGVGYIVGAAIIAVRIYAKAEEVGWLTSFR